MYIIIEGIDTAGKSTHLDILKQKYPNAIFTKEPGGTKIGQKIRSMVLNGEAKSPVAEMLLFLADRAEHTFEIIDKNKNKMIISDRGVISGIAYAKNIDLQIAIILNKIALDGNIPDKIILLHLTKDELTKRLSAKENDSIENRGIKYLLDIQSRMKEAIRELCLEAIHIDASLSIKEIADKIEYFIEN